MPKPQPLFADVYADMSNVTLAQLHELFAREIEACVQMGGNRRFVADAMLNVGLIYLVKETGAQSVAEALQPVVAYLLEHSREMAERAAHEQAKQARH